MKLIVAGATGFVGAEVIRQCLWLPGITSVIALARRPVSPPENLKPGSDVSKLRSLVLKDFEHYSEEDKKELAGSDACIWTLAVTPTKSKSMDWSDVHRICHDYTLVGLKAMFEARNKNKPFRFMYISGIAAERDQSKTPMFMPQYCLMRGKVEVEVLDFTSSNKGEIESCIAKPGKINEPGWNLAAVVSSAASVVGLPSVLVTELSATMIDGVLNGFEKETLDNSDLVRTGQKLLKAESQ